MWLIVGLGNPGLEYIRTRHNIGFLVVDVLASRGGMILRKRKGEALYASGSLAQEAVTLVKPQTFMNRSGYAVVSWLRGLYLDPSQLIVIHDDLDLRPFQIRVKRGGGHGGHRGVLSIIHALGSRDFMRVRIGIGRPVDCSSTVDYVLHPFSPAETEALDQTASKASDAVLVLLSQGLEAAMNCFNVKTRRRSQMVLSSRDEESIKIEQGEVREI